MSGKLDQSLDEITSAQRRGNRNARGGRGNARSTPRRGPAASTAPVGGIQKSVKARGGAKVPTGPSSTKGDSKIIISNLPKDVNEAQIKEYLMQTVGPVKRAEIAYGPNGESRGAATVIFVHLDSATKAAKVLKDVLLDKRPLKIDIIVDAKQAANLPAPKGLSDRITTPKAQPKSAAAKPKADAAGRGGRGRGGRNGRGGRGGRTNAPKKTNEELDSEMADYWTAGAAAETNGTAAPAAATTDAPMEDEIL